MIKLYSLKPLLLCCTLLCSVITMWAQNDSLPPSEINPSVSLKKMYAPEPVAPFRDTLFFVQSSLGSFTPKERVTKIAERIRFINKEFNFHADSLIVLAEGNLVEIAYCDMIIMAVTVADAAINDKTQLDLAQEYQNLIKEAVLHQQKEMGWLIILWRVFLISLIVGMQYFLIRILCRFFRHISSKVEQSKGEKIKTIRFKSYILMDEEKATRSILLLFRTLFYFILFLTLYLSIPMAFSVFPATRGLANVLFGYILTPVNKILSALIEFIPNLITIIIIVLVFRYLIKGLHFIATEIDKGHLSVRGFYPDWAFPTYNIVKILLYAFMFIVIFPYLPGSDSKIFQGVSVFIGIVLSLGSSSIINNIVSGLVLTYMRPFKVGDRIKIGELVGNVMEKTPFVTRVRTPKNEEVTIPNSNIMSAQTFNYSHSARTYGLILHTKLTCGYETPWRTVHKLLLDAANRIPDVLENPKPFVLQIALDDFYVEYQLNVYINDADKMTQIYSGLHQNIQDIFNEAGIEIMSPHYHAHRDGSRVGIPDSYLPDDYKAAPIQIKIEKNDEHRI